jgi:predicted O-methyltransferase YrrM
MNICIMHFTTDWFTHVIPSLLPLIRDYLDTSQPIKALEIGSFQGRSTVWFLKNILAHPDSSITCIDTFEGSVEHTEKDKKNLQQIFYSNILSYIHKVHVIKGCSQEKLRSLPYEPIFDFVYVDGDHRTRYVIEDLVLVFPLIKSKGILLITNIKEKTVV